MSGALRTLVNASLAPFASTEPGRRFPSADELIGLAGRRTGLSTWGDPYFRAGLEALLASLEEIDGLTPLGVVTFRSMIGHALVNRLRFLDEDDPATEIIPPLVITGLPRSGTTVLHRLLALDPAHHAPPLWELLDPFAPIGRIDLRRRRTALQIAFKNRLIPELDAKHLTRADTAEECTLLLANSFCAPLFWDLHPLDGYFEWVRRAPLPAVYADYRRQLEALQRRHPGRRLVLKAPAHLGALSALAGAVPEARIIQTHRDPTRCFFSHCSLRETLAAMVVGRPDRKAIAAHVRRVFEHDLGANIDFHDSVGDEVVHVACSDLREDPVTTSERVHNLCGLRWDDRAAARARTFLAADARARRGRHRYSSDGWGITAGEVDACFRDYRRRFAELIER